MKKLAKEVKEMPGVTTAWHCINPNSPGLHTILYMHDESVRYPLEMTMKGQPDVKLQNVTHIVDCIPSKLSQWKEA